MNAGLLFERIQGFAKDLDGVFTFSDLWSLIGLRSSDRTAKVVRRLLRDKILRKVRRGIYVTKDADLWVLASRLRRNCCVSLDSVLAEEGLIGTTPGKSVSVISPGPPTTVSTPIGRIRYFKIKPDLLFAQKRGARDVCVAEPEKAYLDLLYYHTKGARFPVDPLKDVDLWKLKRTKLEQYLKRYRNPKFRSFVKRLLDGG